MKTFLVCIVFSISFFYNDVFCQCSMISLVNFGNSLTAAGVGSIVIGGIFDETEWDISHPIELMIQGEPNDDLNEAMSGILYNETYL
jgi:hypothetical protein